MADPIEMPFGLVGQVDGPVNDILDDGPDPLREEAILARNSTVQM